MKLPRYGQQACPYPGAISVGEQGGASLPHLQDNSVDPDGRAFSGWHSGSFAAINPVNALWRARAGKGSDELADTGARVHIVGAACRFPGAATEEEFRAVLAEQRSVIGELPGDRWNPRLLYHPGSGTAGRSYTFAGGYLKAPYDFDLSVFGMSPREAAQVDPQQRLLAELVWEALENAQIPPSSLAGAEVGVYVGVSALDHANLFGGDPAAMGPHFMAGNTLSVVANRVSHLYDLRGPSFVVDTACSSSLVAVDRALADLASGRVDTAIVGGVNMLLSPASFVGFSRASMLSPTGACRPFSARGDGYVRSEGGAVFILQRADVARTGATRAVIVGAGVNSDGRTSGIALPGLHGQKALLERVYREAEVDPEQLAFVEAHGTGTYVGDPIEAAAIGHVLGRRRQRPLPIGSVKSNIGHLEPASGVAGMMKAMMALEDGVLPATLHLDALNPDIDFAALNLLPAREAISLDAYSGVLHCGVSSFGFGGTNAHVIMAAAPTQELAEAPRPAHDFLVISAASREALTALAARHSAAIAAAPDPLGYVDAVASGRDLLRFRAVTAVGPVEGMSAHLARFAAGERLDAVASGVASTTIRPRTCFVFSGNGSQWAGMGRDAYRSNADFAAAFDAADAQFATRGFRSLVDQLFADDLTETLADAACGQPLLFAVQIGIVAGLAARGFTPDMVVGHSVGELAAAHTAGLLQLEDCAAILDARVRSQAQVRGSGGMVAVAASRGAVEKLIDALDNVAIDIAAENGPESVTVAGPNDALNRLLGAARGARIAARRLDIDYPYHSAMLAPLRSGFLSALGVVRSEPSDIPMYSTVTGRRVEQGLDSVYWWQNVRAEVQFRRAVAAALTDGADILVEVGPRAILGTAMTAIVEEGGKSAAVLASLIPPDASAVDADPIALVSARLIANGCRRAAAPASASCAPLDRRLMLPRYPWQRQTYRFEHSSSAIDIYGQRPRHPLIGARLADGVPEWRSVLDCALVPFLRDHQVGGEIVVPATALAEMALAAARELFPDRAASIEDFDIVQALTLPPDRQREISVRYAEAAATIEIFCRTRLAADEWTLCARGRIAPAPSVAAPAELDDMVIIRDRPDDLYDAAAQCGLSYGPAFRIVRRLARNADDAMLVRLRVPARDDHGRGPGHVAHPVSLDAGFHGLFDVIETGSGSRKAWVPVRFERLTVWHAGADITGARVVIERSNERLKTITIWYTGADDQPVARIERALLRPVALETRERADPIYRLQERVTRTPATPDLLFSTAIEAVDAGAWSRQAEGQMLLRAYLRSVACDVLGRALRERPGEDLSAVIEARGADRNGAAVLHHLRSELINAEILSITDGQHTLRTDVDLPDPDAILATFAANFPAHGADLALAGHAAAALTRLIDNGLAPLPPRQALLDDHANRSLPVTALVEAIMRSIRAMMAAASEGPLHILCADNCPDTLIAQLLELSATGRIWLSIGISEPASRERLTRRFTVDQYAEMIEIARALPALADVGIAFVAPEEAKASSVAVAGVQACIRPQGVGIVAEHHMTSTRAFQLWTSQLAERLDSANGGCRSVADSPDAVLVRDDHLGITLSVSKRPARLVGTPSTFGSRCAAMHQIPSHSPRLRAFASLLLPDPDTDDQQARDSVVSLLDLEAAARQMSTDALLALLASRLDQAEAEIPGGRFWMIQFVTDTCRPLADSVAAFLRVAMNEKLALDVRTVTVEIGEDRRAALIARVADILETPGDEREFFVAAEGIAVQRLLRDARPAAVRGGHCTGARLDFPRPGLLENFIWTLAERRAPEKGEVEIEVLAAGLNFRDVMLAMGLLNDDVLEAGAAGAIYGFECCGRVVRCGSGASRFAVGDTIIGFGQHSFASYMTAPESFFTLLPVDMSPAVGAALPVAFFTAWYSLVELARIAPSDIVLIHGGAGGVGLAAIQIAKAAGCTVLATVSSPDKEVVATLYGADAVFDSRSLDFAEQISQHFGGVDVVLNSLSDEAMRAGIRLLKPRGRFVELGKRDYVANTSVGLRPFRRNLTYFGVDVDQILDLDPELTERGLQAIARDFGNDLYLPLPVAVHRSTEIGAAFRTMQSAGHIGKIVVVPPDDGVPVTQHDRAFRPPDGAYVVVGGTRGFGLATALWLARKGARRVLVASRSGQIDPARMAEVEALRAEGCVFDALALDVTDYDAVAAMIRHVSALYGPISGLFHTAVTLDDTAISSIDPERAAAVLAPKMTGIENLDRATRGQPLAHFVVYSSASALVGNPGQSVYAAANGYLEGWARTRRRSGLPALAVGWGVISDVGLLAGKAEMRESLTRLSGMAPMTSDEALEYLEQILASDSIDGPAVLHCASFASGAALYDLPLCAGPTFSSVVRSDKAKSNGLQPSLAEMLPGLSDAEAIKLVCNLVVQEVAVIMRVSPEQVDIDVAIADLGLDSLMALELRMNIEAKYKVELPVLGIASVANLRELGHRLLHAARGPDVPGEEADALTEQSGLLSIHRRDVPAQDEPRLEPFSSRAGSPR